MFKLIQEKKSLKLILPVVAIIFVVGAFLFGSASKAQAAYARSSDPSSPAYCVPVYCDSNHVIMTITTYDAATGNTISGTVHFWTLYSYNGNNCGSSSQSLIDQTKSSPAAFTASCAQVMFATATKSGYTDYSYCFQCGNPAYGCNIYGWNGYALWYGMYLDKIPAPTADIKANGSNGPITIAYNTAATISWTTTNATSCSISPSGWTGTSGSQSSGNLTASRTYTASCSGPGGSASDSVTINITSPPTVDIKANGSNGPITIAYNTAATISWTTTNATSCSISPSGWTGTSGSQSSGNLTASRTYTASCSGPGGSASDSVTVNVSAPLTPDFSITISPASQTVNAGSPTTYTVTATSLSGFIGSVSLSNNSIGVGISASYSTNPVSLSSGSSVNSTLTVSTAGTTAAGTYTVTVTGTSGALSHPASASLVVVIPPLTAPTLTPITGLPCVLSGLTYGPGVAFDWSDVSGATSYDAQVSIYSQQNPAGNGDFVNPGLGGYFVYKYSIAPPSNTTGAGGWNSAGGMPINAANQPLRLNPGTTYYWHVRSKNGATTSSWSSVGSFSAAICPASGFTVKITTPAAVPHTVTIQAGDSANYIVTVTAVGSFDGTVTLTPTWVGAPPANVSFFSLLPNPVSVGSPFPVSVSTTLVINSTITASLGSFNFTVTGTSPGFPAQSDTGNLVITAPPPGGPAWIQTIKGDVGSVGSIDLTSPDLTKNNGDYLTITNNTFTKPFREIKNWLIKTSPPYYPAPLLPANDPKTYLDFVNKFTSSTTTALPPGPGLPGNKGVWRTSGSFSWNGTKSAADCDVLKKQATVIFVDGQLNINGNSFSTNCPLVIFVGGNVVVSPLVSGISAEIFTQGIFKTVSLPPDTTLNLNGSVFAQGGFYDTVASKSTLQRDLVALNATTPAEKFAYDPRYLWYLADFLGVSTIHYREAKP